MKPNRSGRSSRQRVRLKWLTAALILMLLSLTLVALQMRAGVGFRKAKGQGVAPAAGQASLPSASVFAVSPLAATFVDITPDNEGPIAGQPAIDLADCPAPCASGRNGGRVNGLAAVPGAPGTYFAASEAGGLFKSADGGLSWMHVDGHIRTQTWDVAAAPGGQRVYATSFFEGRLNSMIGLEVSKDGGATWSEPTVAAPANCPAARATQPSAFGIALRPGTSEVLVGTNCGLARSTDRGDTWERFDPLPGGSANSIWDVVALPDGRTYACGDEGLLTSPDGADSNWQNLGKPSPFPGGFCSLAVSPDQPNVIFVVFASPVLFGDLFLGNNGTFFEGRIDYGTATPAVTWTEIPYPDISRKKQRVPFVATNKRTYGFDLWMGDGSLWRVPCTAESTPSCTTDRTQWAGSFTDDGGTIQDAHGDSGVIVFDPANSVDACPTLYSSDGGVHRNALTTSPACHDPDFRGANVGLHAFLLWGMAGVSRAGTEAEDLYFATQDNGLYSTGNAGAAAPNWTHGIGADVFDIVADPTRVVATNGRLLVGAAGFTNMTAVIPSFPATSISQSIVEAEPGHFMMAIKSPFDFPAGTTIPVGVRQTYDIAADPVGSPMGSWPATAGAPCHLQVGQGLAGPRPYVLAGTACVFGRPDVAANSLWRYESGAWQPILPPPKFVGDSVATGAGFGLLAVDPADANRLYVSVVRDGPTRMMRSADGGIHWDYDAELSDLMSGGGIFASLPADPGDGIKPYPQPIMVAFDPADVNVLVAGGFHSGVFFTSNGGTTWSALTDPFTPGTSGIPHLPRPVFAYFDHDKAGVVRVYLGTGRGVWRVEIPCTITCPSDFTQATDPGQQGAVVNYPAPMTSGVCGTATCLPASGSFFPVGTNTVSCGTQAGPACSFVITVTYPFTGFFPPISDAALNNAKAGQAVAVKFSLGGNYGLDFLGATSPVSRQIDCTTFVPIGPEQATSPKGKSGLHYDASANQYIYVWATDKAWKGTCRELNVKLNDGTDHIAKFSFK
jgi:hypothetical protein